MALQKFTNNATTILAGNINASAVQLNVATGDGQLFPAIIPPQYFIATIVKNGDLTTFEVVRVTNRVGDTMTIVRGQENTSAKSWNSGDNFTLLPTAGGDANFVQVDDYQNGVPVYAAIDTGTASAYKVNLSPQVVNILPGTTFRFKAANTSSAASATMTLTTTNNGNVTGALLLSNGGQVGAGQITAGGVYQVTYDGANFQLTGSSGNYYPPLPQELAAVPTRLINLQWYYGDVRRYGAKGDGVTDDTAACQAAANAINAPTNSNGNWVVTFPHGYVFRITGYITFHSNTSVDVYSTILLHNRQSGFDIPGLSNVTVDGHGIGTFVDDTVQSNYIWNVGNLGASALPEAPAIHIRQSTNCHAKNLNFNFVNAGVFMSDALTTIAPAGEAWTQSGVKPRNCSIRNCYFTMIEIGSATGLNVNNCTIADCYAYRTGDGGFWYMGGFLSKITGCTHVSPATTAADVTAHGTNNQAFPTTWNDEQGIEFENCLDCWMTDNCVVNMHQVGLDVKNGCDNIYVERNIAAYIENNSIQIRDGEITNAVHRAWVRNNIVFEHGTVQYGNSVVSNRYTHGPITSMFTYNVSITDNIILNYQDLSTYAGPASSVRCAGIYCEGPGPYLKGEFPTIPQRSRVEISRNIFDFQKVGFQATSGYFYPAYTIDMTSTTPPAIVCNAVANDIRICDNILKSDVYYQNDGRAGQVPAIAVVAQLATATVVGPNSTPNLYDPMTCKIDGNTITSWGQGGIWYQGNINNQGPVLSISGNMISGLMYYPFIYAIDVNRPVICNNVLNQVAVHGLGSVAYNPIPGSSIGTLASGVVSVGIAITSSNTSNTPSAWSTYPIVNNNAITGAWDANVQGTNSLNLGIFFEFVNNACCMGNSIGYVVGDGFGHVIGMNDTNNGNIFTYGSSGFPQGGVNLNNAAAQGFTNYYAGELLFSKDGSGNTNGVWLGSISASGSPNIRKWSQISFSS